MVNVEVYTLSHSAELEWPHTKVKKTPKNCSGMKEDERDMRN